MPLTNSGEEVLQNMKEQYGDKKGEEVFYASINAKKKGSKKWHKKKIKTTFPMETLIRALGSKK